jgi:hypothetical protein
MLPTHVLERYLEQFPTGLRDIVWELRNLVASVAPSSAEVARGNTLTYFYKQRGGPVSAGICRVIILPDHVRLMFIHGVFLPDPKGLLEGKRGYSRIVKIASYELAPWDDLLALVSASSRFDPRTQTFREPAGLKR